MKLGSFAKISGIAALSALILAGCGQSSATKSGKNELTWVQSSNMPTMDLSKATD